MGAAPSLPPQVYVPARARTQSEAARHRVGHPSVLRLVTIESAGANQRQGVALDGAEAAFWTLPASLHAPVVQQAPTGSGRRGEALSIRLTARGRVVLASLVFFAGLVFLGLAHSGASSTTSATQSTVSSVTVHDGDTLWGIAKRIAPGSDPRAVVDRIKSLNHLGSAALQPGQSLVVR